MYKRELRRVYTFRKKRANIQAVLTRLTTQAYKDGYVHDAPPRKRVRELDRLRKCGTARAYTGLEDGVNQTWR
jgi:hypothetical protein